MCTSAGARLPNKLRTDIIGDMLLLHYGPDGTKTINLTCIVTVFCVPLWHNRKAWSNNVRYALLYVTVTMSMFE